MTTLAILIEIAVCAAILSLGAYLCWLGGRCVHCRGRLVKISNESPWHKCSKCGAEQLRVKDVELH